MLIIGILVLIVSFAVSATLKSKFNKYSQIPLASGISGAEAAARMLRDHGISDVRIISTEGKLTDHYNPGDKTVNLSEDVYYGRNAAAVAVAAHEVGHAVQHARAYSFLEFRSSMVPLLSVASQYMQWIILIGILMLQVSLIPLGIGIVLFSLTTIFSFVTLPVEFDASKRALVWIQNNGVVNSQEYAMSKDALNWAAMTYVVAAIGSLAQLLYLVMLFMGGRRD